MRSAFLTVIFSTLALMSSACDIAPAPSAVDDRAARNRENANAPFVAASPSAEARPSSTPGAGEPIDTSQQDAEIRRLEPAANSTGRDREETRRALSRAHFQRAVLLTGVRQYRAALGDYRRTLQYDTNNEEARAMVAQITNIIQSYGREVPAPGAEPTPLPFPR